MKTFACIAAVATLLAFAAPASAQFAKPEDAIKYRQSALSVMGTHFGRVGAMANGKVPYDAKVVADNMAIVVDMAKLPWAGFVPGTDTGGNTKSKPEVWTEQAKFKEKSDNMVTETIKLAAAAKTGDLAMLKTAFAATADTCKSCHDAFRNK
jgi:cytochrome c556